MSRFSELKIIVTDASFESLASEAFLLGASTRQENSPRVPEIVGSAIIKFAPASCN